MAKASKIDPATLSAEEAWNRAKTICLDLLAARPRSADELRQALRRKGFEHDTSEGLLRKLTESGLIDDADFAESWVRSRHTQQGLGRKALEAELKQKGVEREIAAEAAGNIGPGAEEQRARELVRKRIRTMRGVDEQAAMRRLLGMLARKGYGQGLALTVIRAELADAGRDSAATEDDSGNGTDTP